MKKIAIFASGSGSNAENIIRYFENSNTAKVSLILTNNAEAGVIARGKKLHVPILVFSKHNFWQSGEIVGLLQKLEIDLIVLAGFLWLVPPALIRAFQGNIVNIHPALLPKYGGKGMWGHHVHEAVVANGETESGITIHYVNENYDEGQIIFQAKCEVLPGDSPEDVAKKVQKLEHEHFPKTLKKVLG